MHGIVLEHGLLRESASFRASEEGDETIALWADVNVHT